MRLKKLIISLMLLVAAGSCIAQLIDETQTVREKQSSLPKAVDFSKLFEADKMTGDEFNAWQRNRQIKLRERLGEVEALEGAVDANKYIVGPGDIFSFNIWGALEHQLPLQVSPEGKLLIPSVGEINVAGLTLTKARNKVLDMAQPVYAGSKLSLSLEALRFFRVHVVGEVQFPGTYIARAVDRISEMITLAGGITERAWKGGIEIRHTDSTKSIFNLNAFELTGNLNTDSFVTGGDIIFIPPIGLNAELVKVEADQESSGSYRILEGETLLTFLQRIRALKRNSDLSKILVIRQTEGTDVYLYPFQIGDTYDLKFILETNDRIILPSQYVYVKGSVRQPGAYPYVFNLTAKEYAGMAGGDFRSGNITGVKVYHSRTGKTESGADVMVEPGDIVHLHLNWDQRFGNYLRIVTAATSLILAAKSAGLFDK
ncbi:SLBB domain-containing protein [bacterium]|nr:SLBB domain-containing protein [bacterium]